MKIKFKHILIGLIIGFSIFLGSCRNSSQDTTETTTSTKAREYSAKLNVTPLNEEISFSVDISSDLAFDYETYKVILSKNEKEIDSKTFDMSVTSGTFTSLSQNQNYCLKLYVSQKLYDSIDVTTKNEKIGSFTFDDETISYDMKYHDLYIKTDLDPSLYEVTYFNNGCLNPGKYVITATIKEIGYNPITMSATLIITKGKISDVYDMTEKTMDYSGEMYVPSCNYDGVNYRYTDSLGTEYAHITDAGSYVCHYTFSGDDFFEAEYGDYSVQINKVDITCSLTSGYMLESESSYFRVDSSMFNLSNIEFSATIYKNGEIVDSLYQQGEYTILIYSAETNNHNLFYAAYNITILKEEYSGLYISSIYYTNEILMINITNFSKNEIDLSKTSFTLGNSIFYLSGNVEAYDIFSVCVSSIDTISCDYLITYNPKDLDLTIFGETYHLNENLYLKGDIYTGDNRLILEEFNEVNPNIFSKMEVFVDTLYIDSDLSSISISNVDELKISTEGKNIYSIDLSNVIESNIGTDQKIYIEYGNINFYITLIVNA